jgi:DNA polymerase-3 subunit delta
MIIFLHGPDGYRSRRKVRELKTEYLKKNPGGTGFFEFDFSEGVDGSEKLRQVRESMESQGLFATKKFVVVRGIWSLREADKLAFQAWLESRADIAAPESPMILLIWETETIRKTDKLCRILQAQAKLHQTFELLTDKALERWAVTYLRELTPAASITASALARLLTETGSDLFRLEQELLKLANYAGTEAISLPMIDTLVVQETLHELVFEALDALAAGDKPRALRLFLHRLQTGENALGLLALCAWQLRILAPIVDAYYVGGARDSQSLVQRTGLKRFHIDKVLRRIQAFTPERIRAGFSLLNTLDVEAKSGGLNPALALELFVMKF